MNAMLLVAMLACRGANPPLGHEDGSTEVSGETGSAVDAPLCAQLDWVQVIASQLNDAVRELSVAPDGTVLVAGQFGGRVGGVPSHGGTGDGFVGKLGLDGQWQWIHAIGGTGSDQGHGVFAGPAGEVVTVGWYNSPELQVDGHPVGPPARLLDPYVVVLEADGELRWAGTWGTEVTDSVLSAVMDDQGRVFAVGEAGGLDLVNGDLSMSLDPTEEAGFVTGFAADGTPLWLDVLSSQSSVNLRAIHLNGPRVVVASEMPTDVVSFRTATGVEQPLDHDPYFGVLFEIDSTTGENPSLIFPSEGRLPGFEALEATPKGTMLGIGTVTFPQTFTLADGSSITMALDAGAGGLRQWSWSYRQMARCGQPGSPMSDD